MWLLVVVGAVVDELIRYTTQTMGLSIQIPFIIATLVAVYELPGTDCKEVRAWEI